MDSHGLRISTYPQSHSRWLATILWLAVALLPAMLSACGASPAARGEPMTGRTSPTRDAYTLTYVAIGASDAFGVGTQDPDRQSWPTQLAARLGDHVHLLNLGIPTETAEQARLDELPVALDANPDVVTVWLGVNDFSDGVSLAVYTEQLGSLLATLRSGTHADILVGNLPDLTLLPRFSGYTTDALRVDIQRWNAAIAEICKQNGVTLVDVFAGWSELAQHPEYISGDGLHPSVLGAQRLAELFASALRRTPAG